MKSRFFYRIFSFALILHSVSALPAHASTEQLAAYIKAWGYLKYFHPDVTAGKVNWDSEFVAVYPMALSGNKFPDAIDNLLKAAGGPKSYGKRDYPVKNLVQLADTAWLNDTSIFTSDQCAEFHAIYSDNIPEKTRYVSPFKNKNADFGNEDSTNTDPYPDEAHRVLAIARHWNAVEYFYPNLDLIPSWDDTLETYLTLIIGARDTKEYQLTMLQYCCSIHDTHSFTSGLALNYALGEYYLRLPIMSIGHTIVFRKPRSKIDVPFHPGDILEYIGAESVREIILHYAPLVPHSNDAAMMRNICAAVLTRSTPDSVPVVYQSADGQLHTAMIRPLSSMERMSLKPIDTGGKRWTTLDGNIGYVNLATFEWGDIANAMGVLSTRKAIIFDVRNYPNGVAWALARYLRSLIPWAEFRQPNYHLPGTFVTPKEEQVYKNRALGIFNNNEYSGKVIVLVNDVTQSQAEYTSMMLRSIPGSVIIGSQTAGADGDISRIHLPGGITTIFSGLGVYYLDGKPTQQIGIVPDIVVEPTVAGLRAGRDEVLEKAIEIATR